MVAQTVKSLSAMWETWVWFLDWKCPLEKGIAIHSSILAWRIPWMEEPGMLQSKESPRVEHNWATNTFTFHGLIRKMSLHWAVPDHTHFSERAPCYLCYRWDMYTDLPLIRIYIVGKMRYVSFVLWRAWGIQKEIVLKSWLYTYYFCVPN